MTEQLPYSVIRRYPGFELRQYPAHLRAEVDVRALQRDAGNIGFNPLVRYISGNNRERQSIAMTAPVLQTSVDASAETHRIAFVLPADLDPQNTPDPSDANVSVRSYPACQMAAISFRGGWNPNVFVQRGEELMGYLREEGLEPVGPLSFARFDPPWKPGLLRHNEVLVQVKGEQ